MRLVIPMVMLAGCIVTAPVTKLGDGDDDTDQGYVPGNGSNNGGGNGQPDTFDPGDLGGGGTVVPPGNGGANGGASNGGTNGTPTDTFDTAVPPGGYFQPVGLFFRAFFAVDGSGDVAPYQYPSGGSSIPIDPELDLYFYDAANRFCVLVYLVDSGPGTSTWPGGGDTDLQAWLNANDQLAGFAVRAGEYTPFGPVDGTTGAPCTLDPALFTADPHTAFLPGTTPYYVGAGGQLGTGNAQQLAQSLAGNNGWPALDRWYGGDFSSAFSWNTSSGAPAYVSDAGAFGEELPASMIPAQVPVYLAASSIPSGGPLPRSVQFVYPSVGLTFGTP
ncbi:MAG: hypothetical protein H6732_18435 [Alphaproteobacteria bacterium]|nr:hypothetical protein [Alphaproteobacteria bacterium]